MTLLRMLAFAPEPGSRVPKAVPRPEEERLPETTPPKSGSAERQAASAPLNEARPVAAGSATAKADKSPDATSPAVQQAQPLEWHQVVEHSEAAGVTRMLLEHCVLSSRVGEDWELLLDPRHDTLLVDAQRQAMLRALAPFGAKSIRIRIETYDEESPAARRERLGVEAQQAAEAAVAADPVVQSLIREFGGRVQRIVPHKLQSGSSS